LTGGIRSTLREEDGVDAGVIRDEGTLGASHRGTR
jgi:hypothetical protein